MSWYLEVLKKYAVFNGRARRKEYWMFCLFNMIISIALGVVAGLIGMVAGINLSFLTAIYSLAVLIPCITVSVRRLHDTNRSGWWLLIILVPFIGLIALLVFTIQDSHSGENQYGANPKLVAA
jgi:uncharacterized membrane protein YhaH (DUF805 family)